MSGRSQNPLERIIGEIHRRSLWQVLAIYVVASWVAFEVVQTLTEGLGLPGWLPGLAFVLLVIGLPIVLATAFVQEGGPTRITPPSLSELDEIFSEGEEAPEAPPSGVKALFTWRNAIAGGVLAFALWGVVAAGWVAFGSATRGADPRGSLAQGERPSVAVLPFDNLSPDPDNAYFADGIHDEILTHLAKIGSLLVISRTSVMEYRDTPKNLGTIAQELGARFVVEGGVRRAGDRVRITAQLIEAPNDAHLWAESYERSLDDIFAIQADVARRIARSLEARLTPEEESRIAARPTENLEAYELYLQAREHDRRNETGEAIETYEKAIDLDPGFAVALAHLSRDHSWYYFTGNDRDRARLQAAKTTADSALSLDPDLPEAHLALAYYHYWGFRDYEKALEEARIAAPDLVNDLDLHLLFAAVKRRPGHFEEAARDLERAFELDPRSANVAYNVAITYSAMGRYADAIRWFERQLHLNPEGIDRVYVRTLLVAQGIQTKRAACSERSRSGWIRPT